MRDFLYNDIETIPTQDPVVREKLAMGVPEPVFQTEFAAPSNYKDAAKIEEWLANKRAAARGEYDEAVAKRDLAVKKAVNMTSFNGGLGHVICVGWAFNEDESDSLTIDNVKDEGDLIRMFFSEMDKRRRPSMPITWVGHNWINFDNRFIWQRAFVLGIELPSYFPRNVKPWDDGVHDTMTMWAGSRDMIGMDRLCEYLGIDDDSPDDGMDGSRVAERWEAGDFLKIGEYCAADIGRTRAMHRRMLLALGLLPKPPAPMPTINDEVPFA